MPPSALRLIILGGEALDFKSLAAWFDRHGEQPRVVNMYGITETTVHVTHRTIDGGGLDGSNVIGVPISDVRVHLLDEDRNPVAPGIPGEIYVGGAGVGRGYLNRPDLTAQKFVADPFSEVAGSRLYRSGDLARYLPNGELEYLGRIDNQVKIRGFRIELGEIAAAINSHAAVHDSVVTVGEDPAGQKILIAYLVARSAEDVDLSAPQAIAANASARIHDAVRVRIHRTHAAHDQRKAGLEVAARARRRGNGAAAAPPRGTSLEENIAAIWCAVLNRPHVELEQNFFDVGGEFHELGRGSRGHAAVARARILDHRVVRAFDRPWTGGAFRGEVECQARRTSRERGRGPRTAPARGSVRMAGRAAGTPMSGPPDGSGAPDDPSMPLPS